MLTQCQETAELMLRSEKGSAVITFYFYRTDHFVSQKLFFSPSNLIVKFEKFAKLDFLKIIHNFPNNM